MKFLLTARFLLFAAIKLYNILCRLVANMVTDEKLTGSYKVVFSASKYSSGIYLYKLKGRGYIRIKNVFS